MRPDGAFAVVAMIGNRLERSRYGYRDAKALVTVVADAEAAGESGWVALADALGLPPEVQERIDLEVTGQVPRGTPGRVRAVAS